MNRSAFANITAIFVKEMKETLRDRRTLFIMTLLPVLLYPLLMLGMTQVIVYQVGQIQQENILIAVEGSSFSPKIMALLEKQNFKIVATQNAPLAVLENKAVLGLKIPRDFDANVKKMLKPPRVLLYYSGTSDRARIVIKKLEELLEHLLLKEKKHILAQQPAGFMHPFRIVRKNMAGAKKKGAFEFGRLLGVLLVLMAITFPLYPAIDMAAGEKERGTMETLLVSPATRSEIVLGKYGAIFTIAMVGSILNLGSMGITFGYFAKQSSSLIAAQQPSEGFESNRELSPVISEREPTFSDKEKIINVYFFSSFRALTVGKKGKIGIWNITLEKLEKVVHVKGLDRSKMGNIIASMTTRNNSLLLATDKKRVWEVFLNSLKAKEVKIPEKALIEKMAMSSDKKHLAIASSEKIWIINYSTGKIVATLHTKKKLLFLNKDHVLLTSGKDLQVLNWKKGKQLWNHPGAKAFFINKKQVATVSSAAIEIREFLTGKLLTSLSVKKFNLPQITAITKVKNRLVIGFQDGTIRVCTWEQKDDKFKLYAPYLLGSHKKKIHMLRSFQVKNRCISIDSSGEVKQWVFSAPVKFSISLNAIFTMFITLLPLIGLFSALCLGLSIFARSYKEGQHYLTPLVIIVMPLVLVALVPNVQLNSRLCLIPVANVVLLYKELFLGQAIGQHVLLVFTSMFLYAALALQWAVKSFEREDVLFRESGSIRWAFWRKVENHPKVFPQGQAIVFFLFTMVAFHFGGNFLAQKTGIIQGQVLGMIFSLVVIPIVVTLSFRYSLKPTFSLHAPNHLMQVFPTLLVMMGGLILVAVLATGQRLLIPMDISALEKMYKPFLDILSKQPLWILLFCFALTPGICEEFFFRGLFLSSLRCNMSAKKAIIITAFCFAIMHLDMSRLVSTFTLGVILGYLLLYTRSIWLVMLAHAFNNSIPILFAYGQREKESWLYPITEGLLGFFQNYMALSLVLGLCISIVFLYIGFRWLRSIKQEEFF